MKTNLILDTETLDRGAQFVCDIAWAIVQRNKIIQVKNFIVLEYIDSMPQGEFSSPKFAATMAEVKNGNAQILPWRKIMRELFRDTREAANVYAYNATFDRQAIIRTSKALQCESTAWVTGEYFHDMWRDLWAWASHTIIYKKSFIDFCESHNFLTPKGFCSTSAETVIRYMENNPTYVEAHTARADVLDEVKIYQWIKRAVKKENCDKVTDNDKNFQGRPFYVIDRLKKAMAN